MNKARENVTIASRQLCRGERQRCRGQGFVGALALHLEETHGSQAGTVGRLPSENAGQTALYTSGRPGYLNADQLRSSSES
jgi:hypothetical protein